MTAIAGVEYNGKVWIGGDSASTSVESLGRTILTQAKVWKHGEYIFGSCGSHRYAQILQHTVVIPQVPDGDHEDEIEEFMVNEFIDALRDATVDAGVVSHKNGVETACWDSEVLVGVRGRLYLIQSDFAVVHSDAGYNATGSGIDLSLGSLFSTEGEPPKKRIKLALEAAAKFNAGVAGPFNIVKV